MTTELLSDLTGKPASSLAFGVMQFGGKANAAESRAMYDMARAAGVTIFDAAYIYTDGRAETLLGDFMAGERDALTVISKCGYRPGMQGRELRAQVAESLRRLRTDHVDILYLHRYPGDAFLREALETLRNLHLEGAFTCLGASNFAAWEVMKAQMLAREFGAPPISVLQPMYSLVKRQAEVEILPMAAREGLAVLPYSPLGGGLLSGKYRNGGTGRLTEDLSYAARYSPDWMRDTANGLLALAEESGIAAPTLAVAWVASHPAVSAPIISASSASQLTHSLDARALALDGDLYARLSALSPTPPPATDRLEEAVTED